MHLKKITLSSIFILILLTCSLTSCKSKRYYRQDLSTFVSYLEAEPDQGLGYIYSRLNDFQPLEKRNMNHLSSLISKDGNFIWLKIQFLVPDELKGKDIGLFIGHLRSADLLFLNNNSIRKYGEFPPNEISSGFTTQYFMFPRTVLKQDSMNTILIQVWPGAFGSLSKKIFISEQPDIFLTSDRMSFFNSKITLSFSGVMLIIFFMYIFLYIVMRKFSNSNVYLFYALLNFYTVMFLLPFYISELTWAKPSFLSHLMILKIFLLGGALTTVYFANSFIIAYLKNKDSRKIIITRLVLYVIPLITVFSMPDYLSLEKSIPVVLVFAFLQFAFSVPRLVIALIHKNSRKNAISLLIGFSPVIAGVIVDIIIKFINVDSSLPFFSVYGWQATAYIFLSFLLIRFGNMYMHNMTLKNRLAELTTHLEELVAIRTKELSEANFVLSKGLETVAHVQKNFLPVKNRSFKGWDLSISYTALDNNVSGDLYDYYFTGPILDGLGIFDVSGHGIPAGLMTILAKGIISQHFITGKKQDESISDVLVDINNSYIKEKVNVENYITGLLFRFSEFNKKDVCSVEFANAGHPYPLMYVKSENKVVELKQNEEKQYGIIGVEGLDVSFPPINIRAAKDDIFVCFTDGLTDALDTNGKEFSKDSIISILEKYHDESAIMIMNRIIDAMYDFIDKGSISDDITLIVLKRTDSNDYIEEI